MCKPDDAFLNEGGVYTIRLKNYCEYDNGRVVKSKYAYAFVSRPRYEEYCGCGVVAIIAVPYDMKTIKNNDMNKEGKPPQREYTVHICDYRDELFEMADEKVHFKFKTIKDATKYDCEITADIDSVGDFYPYGKGGLKFLCGGAFDDKYNFDELCNSLRKGMLYRMEYIPTVAAKGMVKVDDLLKQELMTGDSRKFLTYSIGNTTYLNRYLDVTNSPEGVILSTKKDDEIN